ncbi:transcription factor HES-5-like [Bufo gargarizans]|uniref:transcription factor HES-5-like n=1 Tax=Bufo gargarizans TaxID=30331 RepID=UPI001CF2BBBB|nr:transcription factor HES-5-like [Bufo gargarizans]
MAPSINILQEAKTRKIGGLQKNKIRKPVIEKMRRDRINHNIEQLRILMEKDIQTHHQHSKLEKADVLEMAVKFLHRKRQHCMNDSQNSQDLYYQGYYMCLKETVGFLHNHENTRGKILRQLCMQQGQTNAEYSLQHPVSPLQRYPYNASEGNGEIWRPW